MNKQITNPLKQTYTRGVVAYYGPKQRMSDLWAEVIENWRKQPVLCTDGGNDKDFFSFTFIDQKLFCAGNEVGGLTIMLPEEY